MLLKNLETNLEGSAEFKDQLQQQVVIYTLSYQFLILIPRYTIYQILSFVHSVTALSLQGCSRSGAYPSNTGFGVAKYPEWDTRSSQSPHIHTLIHTWGNLAQPIHLLVCFWAIERSMQLLIQVYLINW